MRIYTFDSEANSLIPDKFWTVCFKEFKKDKNKHVFIADDHYLDTPWYDLVDDYKSTRFYPLSQLKEFLTNERNSVDELRLVGHNCIDYDCHFLRELGVVDVYALGCVVRDTYVLSRLAFPKRPGGHSIKAWGERFDLNKVEISDEQWEKFDPIMVKRCLTDVTIQEQVYDYLREKELRGFSLQSIELEHEVQRLISKQRRDGVFLHEQKLHELYVDTKRHADYLEEEVRKVFPPKYKLIKEYTPRRTKNGEWAKRSFGDELDASLIGGDFSSIHLVPFNLDSPQQRVDRLLEVGWKPVEFTPTGAPKLTEDSFANLPEDAPKEAKLLGEYLMSRSRQRLAEQLIEGRDKNGYLHGYVDILGANTHRTSSNSPNLQNIPSLEEDKQGNILKGLEGTWGYEARDVFCVENPIENTFVDVDAKGIQLRGLAHYGGDSEYVRLVSDPKIDIHVVHADVMGITRKKSKTFAYAFLMGAGEPKLMSIVGENKADGRDRLDAFYNRFPFIKEFKQRLQIEVNRGYFKALDGRLIALDKDQPHKAMSVALQSYEAIIMKRAMVDYQRELIKQALWFIQRLFVHDEFLTETKKVIQELVGKTMVNAIIKAGEIYESKCPLDGNAKYGESWTIH